MSFEITHLMSTARINKHRKSSLIFSRARGLLLCEDRKRKQREKEKINRLMSMVLKFMIKGKGS